MRNDEKEKIFDELMAEFIGKLMDELEMEVEKLTPSNKSIPDIIYHMDRTKMVMKNFFSKYPKADVIEHIERMDKLQKHVFSLAKNATSM